MNTNNDIDEYRKKSFQTGARRNDSAENFYSGTSGEPLPFSNKPFIATAEGVPRLGGGQSRQELNTVNASGTSTMPTTAGSNSSEEPGPTSQEEDKVPSPDPIDQSKSLEVVEYLPIERAATRFDTSTMHLLTSSFFDTARTANEENTSQQQARKEQSHVTLDTNEDDGNSSVTYSQLPVQERAGEDSLLLAEMGRSAVRNSDADYSLQHESNRYAKNRSTAQSRPENTGASYNTTSTTISYHIVGNWKQHPSDFRIDTTVHHPVFGEPEGNIRGLTKDQGNSNSKIPQPTHPGDGNWRQGSFPQQHPQTSSVHDLLRQDNISHSQSYFRVPGQQALMEFQRFQTSSEGDYTIDDNGAPPMYPPQPGKSSIRNEPAGGGTAQVNKKLKQTASTEFQEHMFPLKSVKPKAKPPPPFIEGNTGATTESNESPGAAGTADKTAIRFRALRSGQWFRKYKELTNYREKYGHCRVPHNWPENVALAQWVKRQRYQYKLQAEGKHSNLTEERKESLDRIGFVWSSQEENRWGERIQELRSYIIEYGHSNIPAHSSQIEDKYKELCEWANLQRQQYSLFKEGQRLVSSMTETRIKILNDLGFVWVPTASTSDQLARKQNLHDDANLSPKKRKRSK